MLISLTSINNQTIVDYINKHIEEDSESQAFGFNFKYQLRPFIVYLLERCNIVGSQTRHNCFEI